VVRTQVHQRPESTAAFGGRPRLCRKHLVQHWQVHVVRPQAASGLFLARTILALADEP